MARLFPANSSSEPPVPPRTSPNGGQSKGLGKPLSVSALAARVRDVLAEGFDGKVTVAGEVSNFSNRSHWFFSIKDADATVRCVCFASSARKAGFVPDNGMQVVLTGRVDFYDAQGSLQIYVDQIQPAGRGTLEQQLQARMADLREQGYFDPQRKRELPLMPRRVAVVTSENAAALQDVINTTRQRWPGCKLLLYDVRVQGDDAAPQIAHAIDQLSKQGEALGIDAIIVTRGGGSIEDLWAFNELAVAQAIFRCVLPIVAAIGHETDTTIAELVADRRCATPTQAAMVVVPDAAALTQQVEQLHRRMQTVTQRTVREQRRHLAQLAQHPMLRHPRKMVLPHQDTLSRLQQALTRETRNRIAQARSRFAPLPSLLKPGLTRRKESATQQLRALERELEAVSPQRVLERGYTLTQDAAGNLLRSADAARQSEQLTTVFHDGAVQSSMSASSGKQIRPKTKKTKKHPEKLEPNQDSLF